MNRAILDLFARDEDKRIDAIEFFANENHNELVEKFGIDADEIKRMVFSAIKHEGIRREKMARNIIRHLVGY